MKSIKYCRCKKVSEHISVCHDARVKSLKPRCACTGVVLWLNDPPRYEHKSGALASRYANIGQGAVCQWHTFSTDRSGYGDCGARSNPGNCKKRMASRKDNQL